MLSNKIGNVIISANLMKVKIGQAPLVAFVLIFSCYIIRANFLRWIWCLYDFIIVDIDWSELCYLQNFFCCSADQKSVKTVYSILVNSKVLSNIEHMLETCCKHCKQEASMRKLANKEGKEKIFRAWHNDTSRIMCLHITSI